MKCVLPNCLSIRYLLKKCRLRRICEYQHDYMNIYTCGWAPRSQRWAEWFSCMCKMVPLLHGRPSSRPPSTSPESYHASSGSSWNLWSSGSTETRRGGWVEGEREQMKELNTSKRSITISSCDLSHILYISGHHDITQYTHTHIHIYNTYILYTHTYIYIIILYIYIYIHIQLKACESTFEKNNLYFELNMIYCTLFGRSRAKNLVDCHGI